MSIAVNSHVRSIVLAAVLLIGAAEAATVKTGVNGAANWSDTTTWVYFLSGNITASTASTTITGDGSTLFLTEVVVGDFLVAKDGMVLGEVGSITSDNQLDLLANSGADILTDDSYGIQKVPLATDDVVIGNVFLGGGVTVTLDVASVTVNSLFIAGLANAAQVLDLDANTLITTQDAHVQAPTMGVFTNDLRLNTGVLDVMRDFILDQSISADNSQVTRLQIQDGTIHVRRDLLVSGGSGNSQIENVNTGFLNIYGDFQTPSGYSVSGTSTVAYLGSGPQTIQPLPYHHLTIGGNHGINNVTFANGTCAVSANLTVNATFTTGGYVFAASSLFEFTGAPGTPPTISGSGAPLQLDNIKIINTNRIVIDHDTSVRGDLQLLNGKVQVNPGRSLIIGPAGTVSAANSTRYVQGAFSKQFAVGTGQFFLAPSGDAANYAPVLVSNVNATTAGRLNFDTTGAAHPQLGSSGFVSGQQVNRYWTLSAAGLVATFNGYFLYPTGEVAGGDPNTYTLRRFSGGGWFAATTGSASPSSIEGRNLNETTLGDFAAGALPSTTILPPILTSAAATPDSVTTGESVRFEAVATDPQGLPLTFTWNFGDGGTATGNPVFHAFTTEGSLTVGLTVSNGTAQVTSQVSVGTVAPNSGGDGVPNITQGAPADVNPLDGISLAVLSSNGGVLQLQVDLNAIVREDFDITTNFDTLDTRIATRTGLRPVAKATGAGIVIATTEVKAAGTGTPRGKARKTIPISRREVGQPRDYTFDPENSLVTRISSKGKFAFPGASSATKAKLDVVTISGEIELPEGLDLSKEQVFEFSVGNVADSIVIAPKGKAKGPSTLKRFAKAQVKYPKLDKGTTTTAAGQYATFIVTLAAEGLAAAGFDTDGITNRVADSEKGKKTVPRKVQIGLVFAGVAYRSTANVLYSLSEKGDLGSFTTRSSR